MNVYFFISKPNINDVVTHQGHLNNVTVYTYSVGTVGVSDSLYIHL